MKTLTNITTYPDDLGRYQDAAELSLVMQELGLDGLEVMPAPMEPLYSFLPDQVVGVHMRCQADWVNLWMQNFAALDREYGSKDNWLSLYGGSTREALLAQARKDLDYAAAHQAEYVVFHISNLQPSETFTYRFQYQDDEVIKAAAELINELLDGRQDSFYFLLENLWWPGMRLTDPCLTQKLLDAIHYPRTGIMLDTGHLLHTNPELRTQAEGVQYIRRILEDHLEILPRIKGVHLHQTLSGPYVQRLLQKTPEIPADFQDRFCKAMEHVFAIDRHLPFTYPGVRELIERIDPAYLTLEFISESRQEHAEKIRIQMNALKGRQDL